MAREIPTFHDAYLYVERFCGRRGVGAGADDIRAAILDAYQEIVDEYPWSWQRKTYRVNIDAPQTTGTVAYDYDNNQLTLTGATWPSDAEDWTVLISDVQYDILARSSSTVVTLNTVQRPTADITAGTSYEVYRRYYTLPDDFVSMYEPMPEPTSVALGLELSLDQLLSRMRYSPDSGEAVCWAVGPVPDVLGRHALYLWPPHDTAESFDIWYRSQPRPLRYCGIEKKCSVGTIAVTAASAAVTGTSTTFESGMVGSVFRIGDDATYQPTGVAGVRPWMEQRSISTFTSTTSITLDAVVATNRSGVKYTVTDPIDLDPAAVTAFIRTAERNISQALGGKEVTRDADRARKAVLTARGASNRTNMRRRVAGDDILESRWPRTIDTTDPEA